MLIALIAAIASSITAAAPVTTTDHLTNRFCSNTSAVSPSGRYRFDSTHPNNSLPRPMPFVCTGFTIKLTNATTGTVIWEREQGTDEYATDASWVSDSGRVVIASGGYHALDLNEGRSEFTWDPEEHFTDADRAFVEEHDTTAGRRTNIYTLARHHLLDHAGHTYFVVRHFWGKRTFADLTDRVVVDAPLPDLIRAAEASDRLFVMSTLETETPALAHVKEWPYEVCRGFIPAAGRAEIAAFLAGQLRLKEAVPLLRTLEECGYTSAWGNGVGVGSAWQPGLSGRLHSLRRAAHLALRRIGEPAGVQPSYSVVSVEGGWTAAPLAGALAARARLEAIITPGISAQDAFARAGAPDWAQELYDEPSARGFMVLWEYDTDAPASGTMQVFIDGAGRVVRTGMTRPPAWQEGFRRDVGRF